MSEWWTYRPEDFLLFSPRVYWRMFELHNAALWPLQVLALAAGLIIILLIHLFIIILIFRIPISPSRSSIVEACRDA